MALVTVEGVYRDGKVDLAERPAGVGEAARVLVTFLPAAPAEERAARVQAQDEARREAGRRLLARLERGIPFGGAPYPKREELYERVHRFGERDR
jgi:hypothetical protein